MQKRARILDNKNMKRLQITRRGRIDGQHTPISWTFFYLRSLSLWAIMIVLDTCTGFRFELLWPTWLMMRAAAESIQMRNQHCVTTIANPTAARFSILFVCVTATSDLICYLFIPIRMLVFLATTVVWISLYCHTQGGFLRTVATLYGGERSQSWSFLLATCFIVGFELFLRVRTHPLFISFFPSFAEWTIVPPVWPRSLNAFFAAHSIGYPAVLITVSLHYYFNEWKLRRKQGDVSNRNEQLFRILVESLPAEYEGPKDYTSQTALLDDDLYYLDPPPTLQAIQAPPQSTPPPPPPSLTTSSKKNGSAKKSGGGELTTSTSSSKKKKTSSSNGSFQSTPPQDKKKGKSQRGGGGTGATGGMGPDDDEMDDSDGDDYSWRDQSGSDERRGIWIIRFICDAATWAFCMFFGNTTTTPSSSISSTRQSSPHAQHQHLTTPSEALDDENESTHGDVATADTSFEKKNGRTDSLTGSGAGAVVAVTKGRANTLPTSLTATPTSSSSSRSQNKMRNHQQTNGKTHHHHHHQHHHHQNQQKTSSSNGSANGHATRQQAIRDSSHDTNASNEAEMRSMSREIESLRAELTSRRNLEDDFRLQVSMHESNESRLSQQLSNMKLKVEQMEIKCATLERHRESDKSQLEQSERKYAEMLGKKTEIEATLSAERRARAEAAAKRCDATTDVGEQHQRERERQLESEIDKLRAEIKSKEDVNLRMEGELSTLRTYKEDNDIEAIHMELRMVREKSTQMEESLAGENKLKQSLFKCLGDARDTIKALEKRIVELQTTTATMTTSPQQQQQQQKGVMSNGHAVADANNDNDTTTSDQSSPHQHSSKGSPVSSVNTPLNVVISSSTRGSPSSYQNEKMLSPSMAPPPPPDYTMAVGGGGGGAAVTAAAAVTAVTGGKQGTIRYNDFKHIPGDHHLFGTAPPPGAVPSPTGSSPHDDDFLLSNKGKFGAPAQPATTRLA